MSGTSVGNNPRALFDRLISEKSSAFVVKDGRIESSGSMAFRSGLHRMFGQEKSTDDVKANKETMRFILDHVGQRLTNAEMKEVMEGKLRLSGDKEVLTVQDRLDRGTYVSSDLIRQLRMIIQDVHTRHETARLQNNDPQENQVDDQPPITREEVGVIDPINLMPKEERERVGRLNRSGVEYAFGGARHPQANSRIEHQWRQGGTALDRALTKFGGETDGRETTFQKAIRELHREGTSAEHPQTDVWNAFRNYWSHDHAPEEDWTTEVDHPRDHERIALIAEFRTEVESKAAELNARGLVITQDEIKDILKQCLASPGQMEKFELQAKKEIEWQGKDNALHAAGRIKSANERLVREIAPNELRAAVEIWISGNPQFGAQGQTLLKELDRSETLMQELMLKPQESDWMARMIGQSGGRNHPLQVTQQLREGLKTAHDANPSLTRLQPQDVSRLLGDTLTRLLSDREAGKLSPEVEAKLDRDLEDLHPTLNEMRGQYGIAGSTVAGVAGGLLYQRMGEVLLGRAIETAKRAGKDLSLPEIQNEITRSVRQQLAQHVETQARLLPVLDRHVALRDEIESLGQGDGGLAGAPREKLRELDLRFDEIVGQQEDLDTYCKQLKETFGDDPDIANIVDSLTAGNIVILLESQSYAAASLRRDREYVAEVEQRLQALPPGGMRVPERHGAMSPSLHSQVALLPGLRAYASSFEGNLKNFEGIHTLSELLKLTAYEPEMRAREKIIRDDNILFVDRKVKEELAKFDGEWMEAVESRVPSLGDLRVPPERPPMPLTLESITQYRNSLTDYIDTARDVSEKLDELGHGLDQLHNFPGRDAMWTSSDVLKQHIANAEKNLEALKRED